MSPPVLAQVVFRPAAGGEIDQRIRHNWRDVSPAILCNDGQRLFVGRVRRSSGEMTILLPNIPGFVLGAYYVKTFNEYKSDDVNMMPHYLGSGAMIAGVASAAAFLPLETAINVIGVVLWCHYHVWPAGCYTRCHKVQSTALPFAHDRHGRKLHLVGMLRRIRDS